MQDVLSWEQAVSCQGRGRTRGVVAGIGCRLFLASSRKALVSCRLSLVSCRLSLASSREALVSCSGQWRGSAGGAVVGKSCRLLLISCPWGAAGWFWGVIGSGQSR